MAYFCGNSIIASNFMRAIILTLGIVFYSYCSFAQSDKQIDNWLYNLPVKKSPVAIKKAILKNDNFEDDYKEQFSSFKNFNSTYKGTILKPILPKTGSLDSSKIYLSKGSITTSDGYSGDMKWIRFEYFSSDTVYLNQLFDSACIQLAETSVKQKPTGLRLRNNEAVGKGISFTYIDDTIRYRSISASRVRYSSGKQCFTINYSCSDD